MATNPSDNFLWLEDRNGTTATTWAQAESTNTKAHFESDGRFQKTSQEVLNILNDTDKIPMIGLAEGYAYNLWQDANHQRGVWRRTTLSEYKKPAPSWEVLLDIDELSRTEKTPWVFRGSARLKDSDRVLVHLSRNNQDATEMREFSLSEKKFVEKGFHFVESKSSFSWYDQDHLLVSSSLSEDEQTTSGYPRKVYLWKRGEDFAKAQLIFEGQKTDVSVSAQVSWDKTTDGVEKRYVLVGRSPDFDTYEGFVLDESLTLQKIPVPNDVQPQGIFQGQVVVHNHSAWKGFSSGSVMSFPLSKIGQKDLDATDLKLIYQPTEHSSFDSFSSTYKHAYISVNENVRGKILEALWNGSKSAWSLNPVFESQSSFSLISADDKTDDVLVTEEGFLQPLQLILWEPQKRSPVVLKESKSYFHEADFVSEQFWATSKDGVKIPYTVVRTKNLKYDGQNPTLLYGYGGFTVSLTPFYRGTIGKTWLEKGGVYVVANIRGGGEFGPEWHKAAIKENKQKSYDDFIAIAEDLIARKITSPKHLGIQGGSNGGLLVGAVAMQRPELFNAVICQIPLLDMIRYTKLPPGASWMAEYGDPEDAHFAEIISKYSPYQNISAGKKYPKIYFQTTQADDRVHPGHARKMAAKMKSLGHDVYFFESTDGGHGGGGVKLEDQARVSAYSYVYLYQQLMGVTEASTKK